MEKVYKAKRLDNGEWHVFTLDKIGGCSKHGNLYVYDIDDQDDCQKLLDKNTVCQYTGINDSEGNRMFQGDELDFDPVEWGGPHKFFIEWNDKDACFAGSGVPSDWPQWCTLTGHNIHDRG